MNRTPCVIVALVAALAAPPAVGQRGTGQDTGVARQAGQPAATTLSGVVEEVRTGQCEMTTGRAAIGTHVMVRTDEHGTVNLHLGPAAAVDELIDRLQPDVAIEASAFQTERMPDDAWVAQAVTVGGETFTLRDEMLRPVWAIGPGGGQGRGAMGPQAGMGQGAGQGRGAGMGQAGPGQGGRPCWW